MTRKTLWCSFCGKAGHEVDRLIAGPSVFVCNECIDLLHGMIHGDKPAKLDDLLAGITPENVHREM